MSKPVINTNEAGFTLLELVISIVLLGMLTTALYSATTFGSRVWRREVGTTSELSRVRAAQVLLRDHLTRVYPLMVHSGEGEFRTDFSGTPTSINFISPAQADIAPGGFARIVFQLESSTAGSSLVYVARAELGDNDKAVRRTLLRSVKALSFSYFGSDDAEGPARWSTTWGNRSYLPSLIRVQLSLGGASAPHWPALTIRPLLTADAGCAFDLLSKRCQGR